MRRLLHEQRLRLPDRHGRDAGRHLDRRHDAPGAWPQPNLDRVRRVAVRGDEPGACPNVVGGGRNAQVRELRVHSGHDRIRPTRRGDAVDALLGHAFRRKARVDHVEPDVPELPVEPASAHGEHAAHLGMAFPEVQRGRPRRADDTVRGDGRAELGQPAHVVGAVVHRVVRHVDDVVAGRCARGEDGRHAGHRIRAAVDDPVEIDQEEQGHGPGC